jgi:hypothetical protein
MHHRPELSINHSDHLVAILAILFAKRRNQKVVGVLEDTRAESQRDAVLAAVGVVLFGLILSS